MKKTRLLALALAIMIILNGYLFIELMSEKQSKDDLMEIVIERLNFDESQIAAYEILISEHNKQVSAYERDIADTRTSLYKLLIQGDKTTAYGRAESIGTSQRDLELIHFKHLMEIESLCKEEQMDDFESLCAEIANRYGWPKYKVID